MHYSYYKRPLLLLLILYIAALVLFYKPGPGKSDVYHLIPQKTVTLTGKVIGFPAVKTKSRNVIVKVYTVNGEKADGYIYARFAQEAPAWHETVELSGKIKAPYSVALLGNFDWAAYLATKGVFTEIKVSEVKPLAPPSCFSRAISGIRSDILNTFEQNFDRSLSAIAGGVLLGERGEIDPQLYADFQDSGAIHLLVASGGNVGFVTLVVFAFCALFGASRRKTVLLALLIAGIYTLIAGADAPLTRAYFMTVCAVVGYFLHRNSGVFQGLVLSCFLILLFRPASVFETGFQMSFLATLAIVICMNVYELPYAWPRWVKFFVQIFMATLSTQLVLLPVFTNVFFKVSFVGLFSNMVLVPMASLLMAVSFAFYVFSCLHIGFLLKWFTWACLWIFKTLVSGFAAQPFASVPAAAWRPGWIAAYYAGLFLLFHLPQKEFIRRAWKPLLVVAVLAVSAQYIFFNPPTVWLLNEWNKNAILFRAPDGTRILIGSAIDAEKLARAVLKSGARKLDAVLINQNDPKQAEQVKALQQKITVERVIVPFENTWPGDTENINGVEVNTLWGILLNKEHLLWTNRGYSGGEGQDSVSFNLSRKKTSFTVAGNSRFILVGSELIENERNRTRTVKL